MNASQVFFVLLKKYNQEEQTHRSFTNKNTLLFFVVTMQILYYCM